MRKRKQASADLDSIKADRACIFLGSYTERPASRRCRIRIVSHRGIIILFGMIVTAAIGECSVKNHLQREVGSAGSAPAPPNPFGFRSLRRASRGSAPCTPHPLKRLAKLLCCRLWVDCQPQEYFSAWLRIASNVSWLKSCSTLHASFSAHSEDTPRRKNKSLKRT